MTDASILAYCKGLAADIEATWQRIPISDQLRGSQPIPLKATLAEHEGPREPKTTRSLLRVEAAIEAALDRSNATVIFGGPGAGKSVALKWAVRQYARRIIDSGPSPETPVPIYVDLGLHKERESLDDLLETGRKRIRAIDAEVPVTWFLDGLDLLQESGRFTARDLLHQIPRSEGRAKESFVLSTRPMGSVDSALGEWATSERITLSTLSRTDRKTWVDDHCPSAKAALEAFEKEHGDVAGFLDTPLLFAMVLSACLDEGKVFKCDEYPGKAGLFRGFVSYALDRAAADERISRQARATLDTRALEGVFWAAVVSGEEERITTSQLQGFLVRAFRHEAESFRQKWAASVDVLIEAGLVEFRRDAWRVLHQQFAEYWAACHLARRLEVAYEGGWFAAELWDHLCEKRLDYPTAMALSILSISSHQDRYVDDAFALLKKAGRKEVFPLLAKTGTKRAYDILKSVVADKTADSDARGQAAYALGELGAKEAVEPLLDLLADKTADSGARQAALYALGKLGAKEVKEPLVELLTNKTADSGARGLAAQALGGLGAKEAAEPLLELLADKTADSDARYCAACALTMLDAKRAVEPLLDLLADKTADSRARGWAAQVLGELGAKEAVGPLVELLASETADPWVLYLAAEALGKLGRDEPASFCKDISRLGKEVKCPYDEILDVCLILNRRIEPWDLENELAKQRKKRELAEKGKEQPPMTIVKKQVFKQCIVNIDSNLTNVQQYLNAAPPERREELTTLIDELKTALKSAPPDKIQDAEAVSTQCKVLTEEATKPAPNRSTIRITGKGMIEAAKAIADVLPIAKKIVDTVYGWYSISGLG